MVILILIAVGKLVASPPTPLSCHPRCTKGCLPGVKFFFSTQQGGRHRLSRSSESLANLLRLHSEDTHVHHPRARTQASRAPQRAPASGRARGREDTDTSSPGFVALADPQPWTSCGLSCANLWRGVLQSWQMRTTTSTKYSGWPKRWFP